MRNSFRKQIKSYWFAFWMAYIPGQVCLIIHRYPLLYMWFAEAQFSTKMGVSLLKTRHLNVPAPASVFKGAHAISLGGRRHRLMLCILNNFEKSFKSTLCFSQQGRFDLSPPNNHLFHYLSEGIREFLFFHKSPWHQDIFNSRNFSFLSLFLLKIQVFSYNM